MSKLYIENYLLQKTKQTNIKMTIDYSLKMIT